MANHNDPIRERLLYERINKLEGTMRAYDALMDTGAADALRHRNAVLERALWGVVQGGHLPPDEQAELEVTLGNKFPLRY